jgi:radical SAM protein with 4Fe4S-binding SPASM domain
MELTSQELISIKSNVPTCISVDWDRAIKEHFEYCTQPFFSKMPRVYQLEPTSICNLQCKFCPLKDLTRPRQEMDMALFKIIVQRDLKWTKAVELFGFGEPFADSCFEARVKLLKEHGKKIVVATNGLLAHKIKDEIILDIDYLVWDIDAVTKEQYEQVRGGDYAKMKSNLKRVLELREGKAYTALQYIDLDNSLEKRSMFLNMYNGIGDEQRVKFLDSFAGQVNFSKEQKCVKCMEPLYGVSVWSNGDVVMCDRDFDSKHKLGNLNEQSLLDVWRGSVANYIQSCHRTEQGEKVKLCSRCDEWKLTNLRNVPELTVNMFKGGKV